MSVRAHLGGRDDGVVTVAPCSRALVRLPRWSMSRSTRTPVLPRCAVPSWLAILFSRDAPGLALRSYGDDAWGGLAFGAALRAAEGVIRRFHRRDGLRFAISLWRRWHGAVQAWGLRVLGQRRRHLRVETFGRVKRHRAGAGPARYGKADDWRRKQTTFRARLKAIRRLVNALEATSKKGQQQINYRHRERLRPGDPRHRG